MKIENFFEITNKFYEKLIKIVEINEFDNIKFQKNYFNYFERPFYNSGTNICILKSLRNFYTNEEINDIFENTNKLNIENYIKSLSKEKTSALFLEAKNFFITNAKKNFEFILNLNDDNILKKILLLQFEIFKAKNLLRNSFIKNKSLFEIFNDFIVSLPYQSKIVETTNYKIIAQYLVIKRLEKTNILFLKNNINNFSILFDVELKFLQKLNFNFCFSNYFFLFFRDFNFFNKNILEYHFLNYFRFFVSELFIIKQFLPEINIVNANNYYVNYFANKSILPRIKEGIDKDIKSIKFKLLILKKNNIDIENLFEQAINIAENIKKLDFNEKIKLMHLIFTQYH